MQRFVEAKGVSSRIALFHSNIVDPFIPDDLFKIERVFIPILHYGSKHWFLLIFDVMDGKIFIIDSLGFDPKRDAFAKELVRVLVKSQRIITLCILTYDYHF